MLLKVDQGHKLNHAQFVVRHVQCMEYKVWQTRYTGSNMNEHVFSDTLIVNMMCTGDNLSIQEILAVCLKPTCLLQFNECRKHIGLKQTAIISGVLRVVLSFPVHSILLLCLWLAAV